ncbi:hypothetical protein G4B88_009533 [Cannabis sativa]|uniref:Uncharacterized protein n=1 Tax=Cannabis sativa TaxID=3483 RepID=A0A7J6DTY9_CANSA|nr:hypothetical protein G4B88_009533 [Cannabis sativa]
MGIAARQGIGHSKLSRRALAWQPYISPPLSPSMSTKASLGTKLNRNSRIRILSRNHNDFESTTRVRTSNLQHLWFFFFLYEYELDFRCKNLC